MDILPDPEFRPERLLLRLLHARRAGRKTTTASRDSRRAATRRSPAARFGSGRTPRSRASSTIGGSLAFGADGKLYITYGDQFCGSRPRALDSLARARSCESTRTGSIPTDNPFYDGAGPNRDEIWAYGLRNPFRMSVDPRHGHDVHRRRRRKRPRHVDRGSEHRRSRARTTDGRMRRRRAAFRESPSPISPYPHSGRDASITGGVVYRGSQFPSEYRGSYFFGDYVQNTIRRLKFDATATSRRS